MILASMMARIKFFAQFSKITNQQKGKQIKSQQSFIDSFSSLFDIKKVQSKILAHDLQRSQILQSRVLRSHFPKGNQMQEEIPLQSGYIGIDCTICYDRMVLAQLYPLSNCQHLFHSSCLKETLNVNIKEIKYPLICPELECGKEISTLDVQDLLSIDEFDKFNESTFKAYVSKDSSNIFWCPTPGCEIPFEIGNLDKYLCPKCQKNFCVKCKVEFHEGQSCQEFQISHKFDVKCKINWKQKGDQQFMEFAQEHKFKQCPQCKFWVEKTKGCDHMKCKCKYEFCYKCGGVYKQCECTKLNPNRIRQSFEQILGNFAHFLNPFQQHNP